MSRPEGSADQNRDDSDEPSSSGPSLTLIYSLLGLALLAAMVIAGFIVLPFYQRR